MYYFHIFPLLEPIFLLLELMPVNRRWDLQHKREQACRLLPLGVLNKLFQYLAYTKGKIGPTEGKIW